MGNIFNPDFRDFIICLNKNKVEYLLVGGYAVIIHGYHRTTGDLDIWVNPSSENYCKVREAFNEFGLPIEAIGETDFLNSNEKDVFSFGRPPVSIDILTKVKGLNFTESDSEAITDNTQGFSIRVINYGHLIQAKKASGRFRDLNDIEKLEDN